MMRLGCVLLIFGLVGWAQAQPFTITSDTLRKWEAPGEVGYFYCDLENESADSNYVALRMEPHLPTGWNVALCTKLGCLPPGILYGIDPLGPHELDTLVSIDIISISTQDSGWVVTYVMSLLDTNTYRDTLTHTLITYPNGIVIRTVPGIPEELRLAQNYPNPFNPSTAISISIPENLTGREGQVWVHDILGRQVRRLYLGTLAAGELTMMWDGRDAGFVEVPSGTYFYSFSAGSMRTTRAMQLIR